ncbi:MAG: hypothetical protein LBL79_12725 [Prevotella sp.]|jgi:hypothetical protein|nr:hypothetical protein [Prevotella sp.]
MAVTNTAKYSKSIVAIVAVWLFFYFCIIERADRTFLNGIAILGVIASIIGLFLALMQIHGIEKENKNIQEEIKNALSNYNSLLSVSDLGNANKIITEIQSYIESRKYHSAYLKLKELKVIIIDAKNKKELCESEADEDKMINYEIEITQFINKLRNYTDVRNGNLEMASISDELENISSFIIDLERRIIHK